MSLALGLLVPGHQLVLEALVGVLAGQRALGALRVPGSKSAL